jgi:uncharacterized membrane protein YGL010W
VKSIHEWLDKYSDSHQHPFNKVTHWICVPLIALSLLGILWSVPFINFVLAPPFIINWATLFLLLALIYYFLLNWKLAIGMICFSAILLGLLYWLDNFAMPLWVISISIFIVAWIGQFIGHHIEGKRPSFFQDIQFLLIGPLWLLAFIYRKFNLTY